MGSKGKNIVPLIKCKILSIVYGNRKQNMCILCLTKRIWITNFIHDDNYLNQNLNQSIEMNLVAVLHCMNV